MRRAAASILFGIAFGVQTVAAAPHVVGYERFHADKPSEEGGAVLFSELGCANCHGDSAVLVERRGPTLIDLNRRIDRDWLKQFLKDPESGHDGSTMPQLVHGLEDDEIEAVIDYLGSIQTNLKFKTPRYANGERGSALFHEVGCVACHAPTPDYRGPHGSGESLAYDLAVSHPDFRKKTNIDALVDFLTEPSKYRPDGRMPHIRFDGQEAIDLAAHLLDFQGSDPREMPAFRPWPDPVKESVAKGRELVTKLNCAACHDLPKIEPAPLVALAGAPAKEANHCLSDSPASGLPHYRLTESQHESLRLFLDGSRPKEDQDGALTLAALNCYACHSRDGKGGPTAETNPFFIGEESLGDSGRLPPPLTGIGHKLQEKWLASVLSDTGKYRVRPYVKTQMPIYPGHAEKLASWLSEIDAKPDATPLETSDEDIEAGRKLLGIIGGVNCITCHNWEDKPSLGIPALDIASLDQRLRPEWFRSYLLNPAEYRPGTLMPPLWPGGQSTVKDVLEGDSERQIAAIWTFIRKGAGIPEGFPDRTSGAFELKPEERPIIQRTFFEGAGTKAILVGFPGDVHIAYDGHSAQLALVWRGPFFDAYHTWYSRHAPFEKPLSEEVYEVPRSEEGARFGGYLLDGQGNPTFLSSRDGQKVEDSFRVEDGKLIRTVKWEGGAEPSVFHPEGATIERTEGEKTLTLTYSWK